MNCCVLIQEWRAKTQTKIACFPVSNKSGEWQTTLHRCSNVCCHVNVLVVTWMLALQASVYRERSYHSCHLISPHFIWTECALNQPTRYATQHTWCLSQARINWDGCGRKGIWHNNGGMMEVGAPIVWMGWWSARLSVHLSLLSFPCTIKPSTHTQFYCPLG